jgi:hypothetical protein
MLPVLAGSQRISTRSMPGMSKAAVVSAAAASVAKPRPVTGVASQ